MSSTVDTLNQSDFKDLSRETRIFRQRAYVCFGLVVLLYGVLLGRAFYLQVVQYDVHTTKSESNRLLVQPITPNRGLILDRNGVLLADNQPSRSLAITPEHVKNIDAVIDQLATVVDITDAHIDRFKERLSEYRRPYEPVPLKLNLGDEDIAKLAVNSHNFSGVSIEASLVRHYPLMESTAHVLGYVGRINEKELARIDQTNYAGTRTIGKIGLEKFYEDQLHGTVGHQKVEINARGRVLKVLEREPPVPGEAIQLYFDSRLQQVAEQALGDKRGAVVAIDPNTGGILVAASKPGFDPNLFVNGIGRKAYAALRDSPDLPLFNRALRGQYPPGSTLKPFVALAGLELGYINWQRKIYDPGFYQLTEGGRFYRDWKKTGHGRVDLELAIVQSCDTFFYGMAHHMDIDPMSDFLGLFGFGERTALDAAEQLGGILPSSRWKKGAVGESWYTGDSLNVSIGQGYMLSTPLQLATATAVLANKGRWLQPRFIKQPDDTDVPAFKPVIEIKDSDDWDRMITAMEKVVHGERGTAKKAGKGAAYRMAGKTGTAQVIGIKQDEEYDAEKIAERNQDHALFIGFAPVDDPQIAVAVIVENGGGGGSTAAPVARKVFDAYLLPQLEADKTEAVRQNPMINIPGDITHHSHLHSGRGV